MAEFIANHTGNVTLFTALTQQKDGPRRLSCQALALQSSPVVERGEQLKHNHNVVLLVFTGHSR